jgi:hypothetical protein
MSNPSDDYGAPRVSTTFATRRAEGIRNLARDLGLSESQVAQALSFTTGHTSDCLRPEELESLDELDAHRRQHVESCTFCSALRDAMNTAAQPATVGEFVTLAAGQPCPTCGYNDSASDFPFIFRKLGITDEVLATVRSHFEHVGVDQCLADAHQYLKTSGGKVTTYAKEHPARIAAGVATLAIGAGLLYAALRDE